MLTMNFRLILQRVACGGILLSFTFLSNGIGVVVAGDATSTVSEMQRTLAMNQTQSEDHATLAPVDDEDDEDDEEEKERALAVFESVGAAAKKAMKSFKPNEITRKRLFAGTKKDKKLAKTSELFVKYNVQHDDPNTFFRQSNFDMWAGETRKVYNRDDEKAYAAMFSTLLARKNGDEEAVAKLIGNPSTYHADFLMKAQIKHWKARDYDTGMVFDLLKLSDEGDELLNSPKLTTWITYAERNNENPSKKLWELLTSNRKLGELFKRDENVVDSVKVYTSADLAALVQAPRTTGNAKHYGPMLETMLLARWRQQKTPIADALQDVGIRKPELDVWLAYIRTMGNKDPYTIFATGGKFEDRAIAGAIGTALQSGDNNLVTVGKRMQQAQFEEWASVNKKGSDLFDDLKLKDEEYNLFASPLWPVWTNFLKFTNKNHANNVMILTLVKNFEGQKLPDIIAKAMKKSRTERTATIVNMLYMNEGINPVSAKVLPKLSA